MSSAKCSLSELDQPLSLAGDWAFQLDPTGVLDLASLHPDRQIHVPLPWQAAFPELRRYAGYAWYRRSFEVEGDLLGGDLRLRFGAVDYWCAVFLNGVHLGEHEGGYTPFEFGLRNALRDGRNEITVRVFSSRPRMRRSIAVARRQRTTPAESRAKSEYVARLVARLAP